MYKLQHAEKQKGEYSYTLGAILTLNDTPVAEVYNSGQGGSHQIEFFATNFEADFAKFCHDTNTDADELINQLAGIQ
jgi:hypothetical protein